MNKSFSLIFLIGACLFIAAPVSAASPSKPPEIITLDSISDKYEPVIFTHGRHVMMAGNCGTCHHEHVNGGSLPCKDCHSIPPSVFKDSVTRGFLACKGCHSAYSPSNPGMPGLKVAYHNKCFQCHRGISDVGMDPKGCAELCHAKKEAKANQGH
jgi:hypothetical protein